MPENTLLYNGNSYKAWRACIVLLFLFMGFANAQTQEENLIDTTKVDESYKLDSAYQNPQKAALMSAILPGLGQIYNKKYWKVPIVYAGFGTLAFFFNYNRKGYNLWKQAYIDYPDYNLDYDFPLTLEQIERTKNSYKRYRDLTIIGTAGFYLLQIIDATVDAYLFDWDVSEDITLRIEPSIMQSPSPLILPGTSTFALRASLNF